MTIDTSATAEIEGSSLKLAGIAAAGIAITVLSATIAFHWLPGIPAGSFHEFIGYVGLLLFGAATVAVIWRLLTQRGPVVVISPEGIRDSRVARSLIPWTAVHGISTWSYQGQKFMVLAVDPAMEARLQLTRIARWSRAPNRALGVDGLCIGTQGLKIDFDRLLETSLAYARKASEKGSV